jgi:hypothetical protein
MGQQKGGEGMSFAVKYVQGIKLMIKTKKHSILILTATKGIQDPLVIQGLLGKYYPSSSREIQQDVFCGHSYLPQRLLYPVKPRKVTGDSVYKYYIIKLV